MAMIGFRPNVAGKQQADSRERSHAREHADQRADHAADERVHKDRGLQRDREAQHQILESLCHGLRHLDRRRTVLRKDEG